MKKENKHSSTNARKQRLSPVEQLLTLIPTQELKDILFETLEPLKPQYRDDFCLACVAYIRFGIRRCFENRLMRVLLESYCDMLDL